MASSMSIKIRDYAIATLFISAVAAGADTLISNAHAPNSGAYAATAKPQEVATSGWHTFASTAQQSQWSNKH